MMIRLFKAFFALAIMLVLTPTLASCGDSVPLTVSTDTYAVEIGQPVDVDELRQLFLADTAPADTTEGTAADAPDDTSDGTADLSSDVDSSDTVYWVAGGEVWHTSRTCSSLSRSKNINSGTVEEAMLAGKDRVCKRCTN